MAQKLSYKKNTSYWDKWEGQGIEVPVDDNQKNNGNYWDKWEGQGVEVPVSDKDFWDNLGGIEVTQNDDTDFWNNLEGIEVKADAPEDSWLGSLKALGRAATGVVDSVTTLPANLAIGAHNAEAKRTSQLDPQLLNEVNRWNPDIDSFAPWVSPERVEEAQLPSIPTVTETVIDGESNTPLQRGIEFGASVWSPAKAAQQLVKYGVKKAPGAIKFLQSIGSSKPLVVGGAAAGGATSQYMQNEGFGTGSQLAGGLGADLGFQALNPRNLVKGTAKVLGLGKKQFKTDVADAFDRIGVDQFGPALSDSKIISTGTKQLGKTPGAGDYLNSKYNKVSKQFQDSFEKRIADEVGPQLTNEIKAESRDFYTQADQLLPKNAMIVPKNTKDTIANLFDKNATFIKSDDTKELFDILEEANKGLQGGNIPIPIDILVNVKKNLNKIVKWDGDKGDPLALLQRAVTEDIAEYGKSNKQWYDQFQKADQNYARIAKRQSLDKLVEGRIEDPISGEVRYIPFVKQLTNPKYKNKIENILGKDNTQKLEDFITAAKGMAQAERNVQGSPTSPLETAKIMLRTAVGTLLGLYSLPAAGATASGVALITYLISDKRFLNKAKDFAKKPSEPLAKQLEAIVKDNTGYTLHEFNQLYKGQKEKNQKTTQPVRP